MNNTINKRTLQALEKRLFKKDIAQLYGVSPSTIYRWSKSKKPIKTFKDHSKKTNQLRKTVLTKPPARSYKKKKEFQIEYIEGQQSGRIDYDNGVSHIEYEFSDLINRLIRKKANEIIDYNIQTDEERTILLIKLKVLDDGNEIRDIWTHDALVHKGKKKFKKNLEKLISEANKKKYSLYVIRRILRVYLVEKFFN